MTNKEVAALFAVKAAYMALLMLPHESLHRIRGQMALAGLRDYIATADGRDSEAVQEHFEGLSA